MALLPNEDIVHSKCGGEETCLGVISLKIISLNIFHCVNFLKKRTILASPHILCFNVSLCISISRCLTLAP